MADEEKQTKETPEEQVEEEKQPETEVQAEEETKEEEEKTEETAENIEPEEDTPSEEETEEKTDIKEKPKTEVKTAETKKEKQPPKKEEKKKKADHGPDFKYIVRLSNTDIDGEKTIVQGLTTIRGVGHHMAVLISNKAAIQKTIKFGDLSDAQIEKIQKTIDDLLNYAPGWMLNHRKDPESGDDIHLIGSDIDMRLRDEINIMKKIRSYRGIRHERGLPVRGQRTRANNRKGLALGVSKKREPTEKKE